MALGHPKGLFPLFFIEMWERLAFYTMLAILLLYTTDMERGGLGMPPVEGNQIYGMYLAFVYFTPFIGGLIADRLLGYRRAVLLGGALMAIGLFLMSTPGFAPFISGLVCLIIGNGFFKPNISVMVGNLYPDGDTRRDAGFSIFYVGINVGSFLAAFLAAGVRNEFGWLWTFRVAGFGITIGVLILLLQWKLLAKADCRPEKDPTDVGFGAIFGKILLPALVFAIIGFVLAQQYLPIDSVLRPAVCGFMAGMLPVGFFFIRLGFTAEADEKPGLLSLLPIYLAGATFFMVLHLNGSAMTQWARDNTDRTLNWTILQEALPSYYPNAGEDVPRPDPRSLAVAANAADAQMYGQQRLDLEAMDRVAGLSGIEVFEWPATQTAASLAHEEQLWFRRAARVYPTGAVTINERVDSHGATLVSIELDPEAEAIKTVAFLRRIEDATIATYVVNQTTYSSIYDGYRNRFNKDPETLPPGKFLRVINPEIYQSANAIFVVVFTPLVVFAFAWLARRKHAVTTARKIFIGLVLTTSSLLLMALAGWLSENGASKVSALWLIGFYALITAGELCLSPMSLSLITKLSPKRLLGLTMGGWFLATSFGNNFSGFFGGLQAQMAPVPFFLVLASISATVALIIYLLLPKLDAAIKRYC